jgi:hypothetical protein
MAKQPSTHIIRPFAVLFVAGIWSHLGTQTFVQLTDLGSGIGARLTRHVTDAALARSLFGAIGSKVSYISYGDVFQLATDPIWSRVLSAKLGDWINSTYGLPQAPLRTPLGMDITALRKAYVADRANGFVLFADFDPTAQNLIGFAAWSSAYFPRPVDVAWDGRSTPLTVLSPAYWT